MTQQEIQERNKQIALMLGWKEATLEYKLKWSGVKTEERLNRLDKDFVPILMKENEEPLWEDSLRWHSDWNWLMEAVEFINNTHNQGIPHRDLHYTMGYLLHGGWWRDTLIPERLLSDKTQLFIAVSDFAKLYNNKEL
jgi:hypothetical protein